MGMAMQIRLWTYALVGLLALANRAGGAVFTYAEGDYGISDWRTPGVVKPHDADGDGIFGTDGFLMVRLGSYGWQWATSWGPGTVIRLPAYVNRIDWNGGDGTWGYGEDGRCLKIDDPDDPLRDVTTGLAKRTGLAEGQEGSLLDIILGDSVPVQGIRIGVFCGNCRWEDTPDRIRLAGAGGEADSGPLTGSPSAGQWHFFDVSGAQPGDVLTLYCTSGCSTSVNYYGTGIAGLTFDTLPEPATLALIALGACAVSAKRLFRHPRRERRAPQRPMSTDRPHAARSSWRWIRSSW